MHLISGVSMPTTQLKASKILRPNNTLYSRRAEGSVTKKGLDYSRYRSYINNREDLRIHYVAGVAWKKRKSNLFF